MKKVCFNEIVKCEIIHKYDIHRLNFVLNRMKGILSSTPFDDNTINCNSRNCSILQMWPQSWLMNDYNIDRAKKSTEFENSQPNSCPHIHYKSISIFHSPPNSYLLPLTFESFFILFLFLWHIFFFILYYSIIWFGTISHKVVSLWSKFGYRLLLTVTVSNTL